MEYPNRRAGDTSKGPKNLQSTGTWSAIQTEFRATGQASPVQKALTLARDEALIEAHRVVIEPLFPQSVAMLAGGSYGRGQTFPYSELDIVLLAEAGKQADALKELLPEFVRLLWNAGLRPNPAVLTVAECLETLERGSVPGSTLLDRRFLAGDRATYEKLEGKLLSALALHGEKMRQHLCQWRSARHAAYGNTPYHSEPDVKEGPGGLQDVCLIEWLAMLKSQPEERGDEFAHAVAFVSSVRCFLHYHAGCDHNILDFEAQQSLADLPFAHGKTSSEWMREYFQCARTIFNEARRAVEGCEKSQSSLLDNFREYRSKLSNQEFTVSRERLLLRNPAELASDPMLVFRMLEFIARYGVSLASETERRLESSRDSFAAYCAQPRPLWATFKTTLGCPHAALALRSLQATGLITALFPEWRAIQYLVGADPEYRHTIDEHTLLTIESVLDLGSTAKPERQRFAPLLSEIDDVALLLFALLFHEMGRGAADPLQLAAEHARHAGARIGMPQEAQSTVEFLILHQADLSDAMSGRDLDDPATVRLLAQRVGTIERLRLLAVMTYARIATLSAED